MAVFVCWPAVDTFNALPFVFRRFTTRPSSPSASEPEEGSESECGGGGAALRGATLAPRFLNLMAGASMGEGRQDARAGRGGGRVQRVPKEKVQARLGLRNGRSMVTCHPIPRTLSSMTPWLDFSAALAF